MTNEGVLEPVVRFRPASCPGFFPHSLSNGMKGYHCYLRKKFLFYMYLGFSNYKMLMIIASFSLMF